MLVLSRKLNEAIQIGDRITLRVVQIRGNRVRLGIEAPANVRVLRSELSEKVESDVSAQNSGEDFEESTVVIAPFAAEAVTDVVAPELQGADADHWQTEVARRPVSKARRQRFVMPEVSTPSVATAK